MELALEIYTKKKKKTCKFCDEYKRVAVIFKRDTIPIFERVYRDYNFFFNKLFSIPPSKRNNIRHISKLHFSFQFSIQTAIFLLKISSSRGSRRIRNQGTRSSITIIHIILDRNNFSFNTIKFWRKRKKKKEKWKATQDRDANLQPCFFFFFSPFFNSRWFDRLLRRFHGMTREGGEREREERSPCSRHASRKRVLRWN